MKKSLLCGALLALLYACTTSSDVDTSTLRTVDAPAEVYAEFDDTTRTYADEAMLLYWHEGDEISFFTVTYNLRYRFDGRTGEEGGTFSKTSNKLVTGNEIPTNYALYPYREDTKIMEDGEITFQLSDVQSYAVNSFGRGDNVMIATTKDCDDPVLRFKNIGGYLKLQIYSEAMDIERIEFCGNNNEPLAGECHIRGYYGQMPTIELLGNAVSTLTLDCWQSNRGRYTSLSHDAENPTIFWIVLPPMTFEQGFTVTIYDTEGNAYTKSTSKSITISRNTVQPMAAFDPTATDDSGEGDDEGNDNEGNDEPIVGKYATITSRAQNGYEVVINVPEEVTARGNVLRYHSMSLPMYNYAKMNGSTDLDMLLYNTGRCTETSGAHTTIVAESKGYDPINAGQPNVLLIGEFAYMDDPNELVVYMDDTDDGVDNPTVKVVSVAESDPDYYKYASNAVWSYPYGWEPGYYRPEYDWAAFINELGTDTFDSDKYWTGAYERMLVVTKEPVPFDGGVKISNHSMTTTNGIVRFEPTESVVGYFIMITTEEDYHSIILPLLDNNTTYVPWLTASYDGLMLFGTQFNSGTAEFALDEWFADTSSLQGKEIRVFCTAIGDPNGEKQVFSTHVFTMP